ncbi:MAG: hypothetical protein HYS86_05090 [Candidatus Chisholmbacteria bacterium]|nr:hypothetical protein [Candidatus Chisholmbacteria bacterium]
MPTNLGPAITPPQGVGSVASGLPTLISNVTTVAMVVAGLVILLNFFVAGYGFMFAAGDPKKIQDAWAKIWQSLIGLLVIVGAFALIRIVEIVIFRGEISILQPIITGPGTP